MLLDVVPFDVVWNKTGGRSIYKQSIATLVHFLENRLGARFFFDAPNSSTKEEYLKLLSLANRLREAGIIRNYRQIIPLPSELPFWHWEVEYVVHDGTTNESAIASGNSLTNTSLALTAALAEAVERYIWKNKLDYQIMPTLATVAQIAIKGDYLAPERFVGLSEEQRAMQAHLYLREDSQYLWIQGFSLLTKAPIWVPGQIVHAGNTEYHKQKNDRHEPTIIYNTTNGLATQQTQRGAILCGALEMIERDAYMITWLNQLTPPQFDLETLAAKNISLGFLLENCKKYKLRPYILRLVTDAPAYVCCAVIEDMTGEKPIYSFGLKAHRDSGMAAEGAMLEALRVRQNMRKALKNPINWDPNKKTSEIGHFDRLFYWTEGNRAEHLRFLLRGPVVNFTEPWEKDAEEQHLARIVQWCKNCGYEFSSVSLTNSAGNNTSWCIEMVYMPELQPIYLSDRIPHVSGPRLKLVPELLGYKSRDAPYIDDPHPFA
jgi:ribosomal protein S12 methylthiotransferase accessory factor